MHFVYDGFTHQGGTRSFMFRSIDSGYKACDLFCIEVDMPLFTQNRIPMQEGPMLCLHLLEVAAVAGPTSLERFRNYRVLAEDFRPFLVQRARTAAEKALKAPRRPSNQKMVAASNVG
jgi:hypothetical protein